MTQKRKALVGAPPSAGEDLNKQHDELIEMKSGLSY